MSAAAPADRRLFARPTETASRRVDVAVEPRVDGSHVTIRHEAGSEQEGVGDREGWEHFTQELRELLEREG